MIDYQKHILANGLTVLINEDFTTQLAAVNVLYKVGARDEDISKTGFAHLFEHLMFGGSANVPEYDTPLQLAGGTNNAFTTNDLTNYYDVLPVSNIETAFWLESDRMMQLDFSKKSLDVQRNVVCEEFKEHYINKPYGDVWHKLRKLVYEKHPYQWPTIGLELQHVKDANLQDVKSFFYKYYRPNNAILSISGGITTTAALELANKWFGSIEAGEIFDRNLPQEPEQTIAKFLEVEADVPVNVLYKAWKMPGRMEKEFYAINLLGDILGSGESSRLVQVLKNDKKLVTDIGSYNTGSIDTGMFIITGKLAEDITYADVENAITIELEKIQTEYVLERELQRIKNQIETEIAGSYIGVLNKAQELAIYEMYEDANLINTEIERFLAVTREDILQAAKKLLNIEACSTMYYGKKQTI